jgi:hypothetical protein
MIGSRKANARRVELVTPSVSQLLEAVNARKLARLSHPQWITA